MMMMIHVLSPSSFVMQISLKFPKPRASSQCVCDSPAWLQLILTHEHADAILGLDNVRGVQPFNVNNDIPPTPVFVSQHTMDRYKA